jgi:hypothetical protein
MYDKPLKLKEGLRVNIHYRAVNPSVWYVLQRNYGGGPVIAREAVDIYSRDMAQHLKVYQQTSLSPVKL